MQSTQASQRNRANGPGSDPNLAHTASASNSTPVKDSSDGSAQRTSSGSGRSPQTRRQNPQHQLSQIEKSVTHLLVATKQLLETLTHWSQGTATEAEVSDVYVRLGYEFNIACRAFNAIGVETQDLGPVPDLLRAILEETLSQEASRESLDRFLPRIRDIIINLLHGLKKKQQRLRQRNGRDGGSANGSTARQGSITSTGSGEHGVSQPAEDVPARSSSGKESVQRHGSAEKNKPYGTELPPRSSSAVAGGASYARQDIKVLAATVDRVMAAGVINQEATYTSKASESPLPSSTLRSFRTAEPYLREEKTPIHTEAQVPVYGAGFPHPPPPPPPPPQHDALAALQRGGELERRASRRFSAYQIQKHLGTSPNGIPMIPPAQTSPIPNRGREVRDSMSAVRARSSLMHGRQRSANRLVTETSPSRGHPITRKIFEESSQSKKPPVLKPAPQERSPLDSPTVKTPDDKLRPSYANWYVMDETDAKAVMNDPINERADTVVSVKDQQSGVHDPTQLGKSMIPSRQSSRTAVTPSPAQQLAFESTPPPGKELSIFLQYKNRIKKFVLADGYDELSVARLQLAFIEKFAWNTHSNGMDLPEIYLQDPVSGVRHELEDLSDIKDRSVLVLNVEALEEVKRHVDDGISSLRHVIDGVRTALEEQQSALSRLSERQQEAVKEMARLAATPPMPAARFPTVNDLQDGAQSTAGPKGTSNHLGELQGLRRDLAVVRQTYSGFVSDIEVSMSAIRARASSAKTAAINASLPQFSGDSGRSYVNAGKKSLGEESEKIVNRVDDLQDLVEDLRKDVVTRGVRPLARQLEVVSKDISIATSELKKMQEYLKREKPIWTKIWEKELQVVCDDRDLLTMQEELAADLEDDLEKAAQTFALVEEATKQQNLQSANTSTGSRQASRNLNALAMDQAIDPQKAKDGVLGEVRALHPNHETRLEAIWRAEKARQRELESRRGGEFQKELGNFVDESKLKKSGGVEEAERLRKLKDEKTRKEIWERQQAKDTSTMTPELKRPNHAQVQSKESVAHIPPNFDGGAAPQTNVNGDEAAVRDRKLEAPSHADHDDTPSPEPEFVEAKEEILVEDGAGEPRSG